jgi:outer membrane protein assembly factor BamB
MPTTTAILAVLLSAAAFASDAAMFRGNPEHTGVYNSPAIATLGGVKWKFKTGGQVISSPVVVGGTVYVGSSDHNLYAIDDATGAQKWKFRTGSRVSSTPAVSGGTIFFGSYDGNFYAVDATDGKLKWKFQTGGERRFAGKHLHGSEPAAELMPDPFDVFLSSPVVWQRAVYFGSGDGNVYALDANSGALKWKFHTGDVVHASPAIADGTLFVGSWDSYFYAIDAVTGQQKWRFKTGEDHEIYNQVGIQSSAAVADGTVYFGCRDSNFYALEEATGKQKWAFNNHGSWVVGSPAVQGSRVYFATSDSGLFHVLDAASGAPVFELSSAKWPMFSSLAIAANTAYVGSNSGKLFAIDLTAQKIAWEFQTDASRKNGPELTKPDGTPKYEAAFRDNFYDDIVSGLDRMMSVGAILSSPAIVNGVIYVGSTDGYVYALM